MTAAQRLLAWCSALIFFGRAYQYVFFNAPFRAFFWDESLLEGTVERLLGVPWNTYATDPRVDACIAGLVVANGVVFLLSGVASLLLMRFFNRWLRRLLGVGTALMLALAILETKEHWFHVAQFFEYAIQVGVPWLFWHMSGNRDRALPSRGLRWITAATFFAHAAYAIGLYPVPGHFIDMTIACLSVTEDRARTLLLVVGILDILMALCILWPSANRLVRYALFWGICWGLLTAVARPWSTVDFNQFGYTLHQSVYAMVYRLPHGLVPLLLFLHMNNFKLIQRSGRTVSVERAAD